MTEYLSPRLATNGHQPRVRREPIDTQHVGRPETYLEALRGALSQLDASIVDTIAQLLLRARDQGRTVYIIGNGGSASTATHLATDLSKGTAVDGLPGVRAVSLADNVALLTAWANDTAYEQSFSGPVQSYVVPGDVLIAISASGRSPNVLRATRVANRLGAITVGLTGFGGGYLARIAHVCVVVDAYDYGLVEDVHLAIGHALTAAVGAQLAAPARAEHAKAA